eukprot:750995-Hanusia_phi.AAC.2
MGGFMARASCLVICMLSLGRGAFALRSSSFLLRSACHQTLPIPRSICAHGKARSAPCCSAEESSACESKFFSFEGIIGAGKSTLLRKLQESGVLVIPEPLQAWQENGIFEAFYKDMSRWSFTFQIAAFTTRVNSVESALVSSSSSSPSSSLPWMVGERSWFADSYVFEPLLHRDGHLNHIEHENYRQWWQWAEKRAPKTSGIIYLRASPATCLQRIKKRSRAEEVDIPLEYLRGLYEKHEDWLMHKKTPYGDHDIPVLVLDADVEFESDQDLTEVMCAVICSWQCVMELQAMLSSILNFMKENGNES